QLGALIGQTSYDAIINTRPGLQEGRTRVDDEMEALQRKLMAALKDRVREEHGLELLDFRLPRFHHPPQARHKIFARIRSERKTKANEHLSEGERKAGEIESDAKREAEAAIAKARADEKRIKGQADAEAAYRTNQAYTKDPEFYALLKSLENLERIL